MSSDNPFYTLADARNYTLSKVFKKAGLNAETALKDVLKAASSQGGYAPNLRFPDPEKKEALAKMFHESSSTAKASPKQSWLAGANAMIRHLKDENSEEAILRAEAMHKVNRPIDLTLRQIAFVAKVTGTDFWRLIKEIGGVSVSKEEVTATVKNWKGDYVLEKQRHEETKEKSRQYRDELKGAARTIAALRRTIHEAGLQDPTLSVTFRAGAVEARPVNEGNEGSRDTEGTSSGGSSQGAV